MLDGNEDEADQAVVPGRGFDGLQVVPSTSGWLKARTCRSSEVPPVDQAHDNTSQFRRAGSSIAKASWESGADEFRFHELGMNRKART